MAYVDAPNQGNGLNLHPGSTGWDLDNAALHHIPKPSINQDDAFGSETQIAQLQQSSPFCVVTGCTLSCVQAYCRCNTSNGNAAGAA